jgi:hypothetical protein
MIRKKTGSSATNGIPGNTEQVTFFSLPGKSGAKDAAIHRVIKNTGRLPV